MRAVLSRVPEGVWVITFGSVRRPERGIVSYRQPGYVQRCNSLNLYTVPLGYHKSTGRLMFLKNSSEAKIWLKNNWRKSKRASFSHYFLHSHTDSHSYTLFCYFTQGKKWLQKSFSQKPLRKLLQWQTNTLGAPSSQERDFFLGAIFHIQNIRICPADNIQRKRFWINQPLQTKGLIQGYVHQHAKILRGSTFKKPSITPSKAWGRCVF